MFDPMLANDEVFYNDMSDFFNVCNSCNSDICNCRNSWFTKPAGPSFYEYPDFSHRFLVDINESLSTYEPDILLHDSILLSRKPNYVYCHTPVHTDLNIPMWRKYSAGYHDSKVLDFLEFGWPINFTSDVLPNPPQRPGIFSMQYETDIENYIKQEIESGHIIGPYKQNPFRLKPSIAPIFSVPKKEGGRRVIVDCSFGGELSVNAGIKKDSFLGDELNLQYPRHDKFIELLWKYGQGCHMFKIDLSKAFRQFAIDPRDYFLQCFEWKKQMYVDKRLIFGMRSSPQACQRSTNLVNFILSKQNISTINYIDDFGGVADPSLAHSCFEKTLEILNELGLKVSKSKCAPPSQEMVFLGKEYNTKLMTVKIPSQKLLEIIEIVKSFENRKKCTKRQLQQLVGKLAFAAECVRGGRLFISRMLDTMRKYKFNHYRIYLDSEFHSDIKWWISFFETFNGISYIPDIIWSKPDTIISTDACLTGLGGINSVTHEYFHCEIPTMFSLNHIGVYEILAIYIALRLWSKHTTNKRIQLYCDNQSVISILNSGKGKDKFMLHYARQICMLCANNNSEIRLVYVASSENRLADCLSRWYLDSKYRKSFADLLSNDNESYTELDIHESLFDNIYNI